MLRFYPLLPTWMLVTGLALAVLWVTYIYKKKQYTVTPFQKRTLYVLRLLSLGLVFVMCLCPGMMSRETNTEQSAVVVLVDQSKSMDTKDMNHQTRFNKAVEFVDNTPFSKLSDFPIHYFTFNHSTNKLKNRGAVNMQLPFGGTNLKQAMAAVNREIGFSKTSALVLLSDGIDASGFKGSDVPVPIFCVRTGTALEDSKDLGIDDFSYPERITINEEINIEIPIHLFGYPEQDVHYSISVDNQKVDQKKLLIQPGRQTRLPFSHQFRKTGVHVITIQLEHLLDEATILNNTRHIAVEVSKRNSEIAVYFPVLSNSFRPLIRYLETSGIKFSATYKLRDNVFRSAGNIPQSALKDGIPESPEALRRYAVLVLGASSETCLNASECTVLEKYVSGGGSLVLLGGRQAFQRGAVNPVLSKMLPVRLSNPSFTTGQFTAKTSPQSQDSFTEGMDDIINDNKGDRDFYIRTLNKVSSIKNNARILLWAEAETPYPLVVSGAYGRGKTIAVLSNALQLWGNREIRKKNYARFWGYLLKYAQNDDDHLLKVSVNKTELTADEPLDVMAAPDSSLLKQAQSLKLEAALYQLKDDFISNSIELNRTANIYKGTFAKIAPGNYALKVTCFKEGKVLIERYKFITVDKFVNEYGNLQSVRENFYKFTGDKNIYELTEGKRIEADLARMLTRDRRERERLLIFETPYFFLALLTLLAIEWILTRKYNLV